METLLFSLIVIIISFLLGWSFGKTLVTKSPKWSVITIILALIWAALGVWSLTGIRV